MNKNILAIAVAAAMVATATVATAGEPTFYGKLHMSLDSVDNGGDATTGEDGIFVSSNSSRLGLKGAVDLDGGMKVVYKYEMSTDYSSESLRGNRNAYIGLKGGFGQITAGRQDMPFKTIGRKADLFGDTIGDHRAITRLGKDNIAVSGDDWADRRDNVVMYSNKFGAVGVVVALGQEENADKGGDTGVGINYKQGPLAVSFAHETHGKGNLKGFGVPADVTKDSTGMMLTGSYKMGSAAVIAGVGQIESLDGSDGSDGDIMTLAAKMKSGMNTFKIQYTSTEFDGGDTATVTALGVDHKLGAKTTAYAVYAAVANDNTPFGFGGTGHSATVSNVADEDASGFSLGLIHKF